MPYHYDQYSGQYYDYDDAQNANYDQYAYSHNSPQVAYQNPQQYRPTFPAFNSAAPSQPAFQYNFGAPVLPNNSLNYNFNHNQPALSENRHLYQPYNQAQVVQQSNHYPPQQSPSAQIRNQPRIIVPPSPNQQIQVQSRQSPQTFQTPQRSHQAPGPVTPTVQQQKQPQVHSAQATARSVKPEPKNESVVSQPHSVNLPPKFVSEEYLSPAVKQEAPHPSPVRTIPVVQVPPRQAMASNRVLKETTPNKFRQQSVTKVQTSVPSYDLSTQGPSMLLSLADEYIDAARKLEARNKDYYTLISTGLACLEQTLNNFKLTPLREAQLSLRYAQLLYEETTNIDEAETVLSKAIGICDRMSFLDLKYALQMLLIKVLFESTPKAALRDFTDMIKDLEAYRHNAWEYAFRFQAVFFHMRTPNATNLHDAVYQLERIQQTAKLSSDHVIYVFAALMETLIRLNETAQDSSENAQRALAKARSLQLNPEIENHPQIVSLIDVLDVLCCLTSEKIDTEQLLQRRKIMAKTIANVIQRSENWTKDELIWLRVNTSSTKGLPSQEGGLVQEVDGKLYIALEWMGKLELEGVGYLINALCWSVAGRPSHEKAKEYMYQGYKIPNDEIFHPASSDGQKQRLPKPISVKDEAYRDRAHLLAAQFQAETALMEYAQGSLEVASKAVSAMQAHLSQISKIPPAYQALLDYLRGCIYQANGDLKRAVKHYQAESLRLPQRANQEQATPHKSQQHTLEDNFLLQLQLLAAMNLANIIRDPDHPQHQRLQSLVNNVSAYMTPNAAPKVRSSYNVLMAAMPTDSTTLQAKQLLSTAMYIGRDTKIHQITSVALSMIQDRFFRGGVQDAQAVKSARAAMLTIRDKWQNVLWWAVAGNMELESLLIQLKKGNGPQKGTPEYEERKKEINTKYKEIHAAWAKVPEKVKEAMLQESG